MFQISRIANAAVDHPGSDTGATSRRRIAVGAGVARGDAELTYWANLLAVISFELEILETAQALVLSWP